MISFLLTIHLLLFGIKAWVIFKLAFHIRRYPYMFTWSLIYLFAEAYFLHKFFINIDMFYYEIVAIIDQGVFTIGLIFYLVKEAEEMAKGRSNGGNRGGGKNGGCKK